jgi:hypothetical protein
MIPACPERNDHRPMNRRFQFRAIGLDQYRCECGCEFRWESQFVWEVLRSAVQTGVEEAFRAK